MLPDCWAMREGWMLDGTCADTFEGGGWTPAGGGAIGGCEGGAMP